MKKISKIFIFLLLFIINVSYVYANNEKNLVNIYLFYSDDCPHCKVEKKLLKEIEQDYDNVRIYQYEVHTSSNEEKLLDIADLLGVEVKGVPFTVIANKVFMGFNYDNYKSKFLGTIEYYSDNGYEDKVGKYLGVENMPSYSVKLEDVNNYKEFMANYGNHVISIFGFKINTKNLTLPIISILIGFVDGFNPCAMWVLLFLISMLIGMKDKINEYQKIYRQTYYVSDF